MSWTSLQFKIVLRRVILNITSRLPGFAPDDPHTLTYSIDFFPLFFEYPEHSSPFWVPRLLCHFFWVPRAIYSIDRTFLFSFVRLSGALLSFVFESPECSVIFLFECPKSSSHFFGAKSALVTLLFECLERSNYFVIWMPGALWSFVFECPEHSGHFLIWLPRALQYYFFNARSALVLYLHLEGGILKLSKSAQNYLL